MRVLIKARSPSMLPYIADEVERRGGRVIWIGRSLPVLIADIPEDGMVHLASMPEVESMDLDEESVVQLSEPPGDKATIVSQYEAVSHINAPLLWETGITGRGAVIAVIDTGVCDINPAVVGKVVHRESVKPGDPCETGHGTFVASTIAGDHTYIGDVEVGGVAPDARIVDIKALDERGRATTGDVVRALDTALSLGAKLINISLGIPGLCCSGSLPSLITHAVRKAVIVAAAGNSGPRHLTISCPSCLPPIIAVGATSVRVPRPDTPAHFSSRGPGCMALKPDVSAPGGAGDKEGKHQPIEVIMGPYGRWAATMRGTSVSAPMVTGVLALAWQLYGEPPTEWSPHTLVQVASRPIMDYPNVTVGHGVIDASRIPGSPPESTKTISRIAPILAIGGVMYALSRGAAGKG